MAMRMFRRQYVFCCLAVAVVGSAGCATKPAQAAHYYVVNQGEQLNIGTTGDIAITILEADRLILRYHLDKYAEERIAVIQLGSSTFLSETIEVRFLELNVDGSGVIEVKERTLHSPITQRLLPFH